MNCKHFWVGKDHDGVWMAERCLHCDLPYYLSEEVQGLPKYPKKNDPDVLANGLAAQIEKECE